MRGVESEKRIDAKLRARVKGLGGEYIKLPTLHFAGLPDRLVLLSGGRAFFVELKTTGKEPTKLQNLVHKRLKDLGFVVEVVDNSEKINNLFK